MGEVALRGGALWQRCDKWAEPVFVRGGFERLCKCDAFRRIRQEAQSRMRSTRIPAPNLSDSETREKGEGERGRESVKRERRRVEIAEQRCPPSRAASVALRSRGSQLVVEFKAICERCWRKREILERLHVIGSADRPPGKVRHLCGW